MTTQNDNLRNTNVSSITPLAPPSEYWKRFPATPEIEAHVASARAQIEQIVDGTDDRVLLIVGPCSIHDTKAGLEYAGRIKELSDRVKDRIMVVMRVYFEKPRTALGWKGLINDPNLNGTYDVSNGLAIAREFLLKVNEIGLPTAIEWLDPFTPQYLGDLVAWGAIGARTTESQTHRLVASGLSMPIGFKNGTGGSVQIAVDGIVAARSEHVFLGIDDEGAGSIVHTTGNPACHLILRGGKDGPNYDAKSIASAMGNLSSSGLEPNLIIDCSHANSNKDHRVQPDVFRDVIEQRVAGTRGIVGLMLESHLFEGSQSLGDDPSDLKYGVSITDACCGWDETVMLVTEAYERLGS
jgi:3-deoxy-7-phosphoheptulonate synthase